MGMTLVSVGCSDFQWILSASGVSCLRFHGHMEWCAHTYSDGELTEFTERALGCDRNCASFNKDTCMLENAKSYSSLWR